MEQSRLMNVPPNAASLDLLALARHGLADLVVEKRETLNHKFHLRVVLLFKCFRAMASPDGALGRGPAGSRRWL